MDRRNFLQRLAVLVPAISLVGQYRTQEENERLRLEAEAKHPMHYARVTVECDSNGEQQAFYETAASPDGPWRRSRTTVRHGLPSTQWRTIRGPGKTDAVMALFKSQNELLLHLPWTER